MQKILSNLFNVCNIKKKKNVHNKYFSLFLYNFESLEKDKTKTAPKGGFCKPFVNRLKG